MITLGNNEFIYLCEEETIKAGVLDMVHNVDLIEETFRLLWRGDYLMGGKNENEHGVRIFFPKEERFIGMPVAGPDRRFMAMTAYLGGKFRAIACKWYGSNIANKEKGLPRSIHTVTLNDVDTGRPLAIMSGGLISSIRTGLVPTVAARHLACKGQTIVGLVGAGVINRATLQCLKAVLPDIKEVRVYDLFPTASAALAKDMSHQLSLNIVPVDTLEGAIRDCDVIHMAIAGAQNPMVLSEWLKPGALLEISGHMDHDDALLTNNNIVLDSKKMERLWYGIEPDLDLPSFHVIQFVDEGKIPEEKIVDLGAVVDGDADPQYYNNGKPTVFIAMGMPVYDVAIAWSIYKEALKQGLGTKLKLWDAPYFK